MDKLGRYHEISNADRKTLIKARDMLDILLTLNHKMPVIYARSFLEITLSPGKGPTSYGHSVGISQPNMSRVLLELGAKSRHREDGLKLVDKFPSLDNAREQEYHLTLKGLKLMFDIVRTIE